MKKTITIEGHPVEIDSAQGWLYRYKEQFGHDIMPDLFPIVDALLAGLGEIFKGIAVEDDKTYLDVKKIPELLNNDAVREMFAYLSGMEVLTITNIFWAMAKNANYNIEPPERFINNFDPFPYDVIAPALLYLVAKSSISSKNSESLLKMLTEKVPSILTLLQSQESTEG